MKIRKSRLKEIIKEEVNSFKFIPINEGHGGKSLRAADETESQLLSRLANTLMAMSSAAENEEASGDRIPHSTTGPLADIVGTLQQLIDDDTMSEDFPPGAESEEAAEEKAEAEANESTRLLDEIIVQEIIKALGEAGEHERAANALDRKSEKTPLGHNEKAARDYHRSQAEKENA
jgi:hypothetical protein